MNKAIIFGTFEFLGFHFSTKLLEKGLEVIGVHLPRLGADDEITQKKFAIGRNANFDEVNLDEWLLTATITEQTLVIIDYYDYYIQMEKALFNKQSLLQNFFQRNAKQLKETESSIIMLLPIQWATSTKEKNQFLPIIESHCIYLPTIYGPWQSNVFLFQQALLKKFQNTKQLSLNEREWIEDAIYIDDAVHSCLALINNPPGYYLLKSEMKDHWQQCAQYLKISLNEFTFHERNSVLDMNDIQVKLVRNERLVSEGIEEQQKPIIFLLKG